MQQLYGACLRTREVVCLTKRKGDKTYHTAPLCYCLLSRTPALSAMFGVLSTMLREQRRVLPAFRKVTVQVTPA